MAYTDTSSSTGKSSAELEREVEDQRNRVEARIGEIKDRLSPGQLIDELMSYTKDGGQHFAANLGQQVQANPLPAALLGVSLVWLMTSNMNKSSAGSSDHHRASVSAWGDNPDNYPYAKVKTGGLKRISHKADEAGQWWSEFQSDAGDTFKARSTELGERAGHFTDQSGKMFSGFIDETGNRVSSFTDTAGNRLNDAMGWATHSWNDARHAIGDRIGGVASSARQMGHDLASNTRDFSQNFASGGRHLGQNVASTGRQYAGSVQSTFQSQSDMIVREVGNLMESQPLIVGALAFAAGAALGAALPHTSQEDELIGEHADRLRGEAARRAGELYEQGKEQASHIYEEATSRAGQIYDEAKDKVADIASSAQGAGTSGISKH